MKALSYEFIRPTPFLLLVPRLFCTLQETFSNVPLEVDEEKGKKKKKVPRRILHFSDGILEEYSTDEDEEEKPPPKPVDPVSKTKLELY